jgi:predicted permease
MTTFATLSSVWLDFRYALRVLRKSPGFAVIAVLTLALGIGANTAIFTVLDALILRELPVRDAGRLVAIYRVGRNGQEAGFLLPMMEEIEKRQQVFSGMSGWAGDRVLTTETNGLLSPSIGDAVSGNYYSILGARPLLGRLIGPDDDRRAAPAMVVVISYNFWRDRYGGDAHIIGKTLRVEGLPLTVIGVTPKDFPGLVLEAQDDFVVPLASLRRIEEAFTDAPRDPNRIGMRYAVARLKPGVSIGQARAQLQTIWPSVLTATAVPSDTRQRRAAYLAVRVGLKPAANGFSFLRDQFTRTLYVLIAISGLVLLIACLNLAGLLLARAAARSHEMAVRVALGASRWRIARQLLTESLILSVVGASLGLASAGVASRAMANFISTQMFRLSLDLRPDSRVLVFTTAAAILTGLLFGLAPAWKAAREDPNAALQQGSRAIGRGTNRFGKSLIAAQVALSLALVMVAGLFVRSLQKLRAVDPGFQTRDMLEVELYPQPGADRHSFDVFSYYDEQTLRLESLPGVLGVSMSEMLPGGGFEREMDVWPKRANNGDAVTVDFDAVTPGFLGNMGLNLVRGRFLAPQDDARAPRVAVVTESLARQLFPRGDALGQVIRVGSDPARQSIQIAGVTNDARLSDLRDQHPLAVFVPAAQEPNFMISGILEVRTAGDPGGLAGAIRQTIESLGRQYPLEMKTVEQTIDGSLMNERIAAILSEFFGILALLLAAIGVFGLTAHAVTRRTREIGIRMALGAPQRNVLWIVLREALLVTLAGIAIGLPIAMAGARLIAHMLFGVSASDPATFAVVAVTLLVVSAIAGFLPARGAARVDPMAALRSE